MGEIQPRSGRSAYETFYPQHEGEDLDQFSLVDYPEKMCGRSHSREDKIWDVRLSDTTLVKQSLALQEQSDQYYMGPLYAVISSMKRELTSIHKLSPLEKSGKVSQVAQVSR